MAQLADPAGIFVGDTLDVFDAMEAAVAASGDTTGAQERLKAVMEEIVKYRRDLTGAPGDLSASTDSPR